MALRSAAWSWFVASGWATALVPPTSRTTVGAGPRSSGLGAGTLGVGTDLGWPLAGGGPISLGAGWAIVGGGALGGSLASALFTAASYRASTATGLPDTFSVGFSF